MQANQQTITDWSLGDQAIIITTEQGSFTFTKIDLISGQVSLMASDQEQILESHPHSTTIWIKPCFRDQMQAGLGLPEY